MGRTICLVVYLASLALSIDGYPTSMNSTANVVTFPAHGNCSIEEFRCTNGECIPSEKLCDTKNDCTDSSDEQGCCADPERYFTCHWSRNCIHVSLRCDKYNDCADGSDEENCSQKPRHCGIHSVPCDGGTKCIPKKWVCDRGVDCKDGSDEADCKDLTCPPHSFMCKNRACIPPNFVCDGDEDCRDGSDESDCDSIKKCDVSREMQCDTKLQCVPLEAACNKTPDCTDGSDEGGDCSKPTLCDNHCSHECYKTPKGAVCVCPPSYNLNPDGRTCSDINECRSNSSVCGHFCNNQDGGYICTCAEGYSLQKDNTTCLTTIPGHSFLIMSIGNDVRLLYLKDHVYDLLHHGEEQVQGVSYDPVDDVVYWHDGRNVYRKSRKSDGLPEEILSGLGTIGGIAVDWYGRNLYLTDKIGQAIVVCASDGAACLPLIKEGVERPCEIRIDPVSRYVFWTDIVNKQIERAGLDGSDRKVLVKREIGCPSGLALDTAARRVYWFDASKDTAEHVDYDGDDLKHLPETAMEQPYSLSVWEDTVYWSDLDKEAIMAANKRTGKNKIELKKFDNTVAHGIYVYHPALNEQVFNPCGASFCSHLCLLSPGTLGFACRCPSGMTILDGNNCKGNVGLNHLLLGVKGQLNTLQQLDYGSHIVKWESNVELERCSDIDYDPVQDRVIVSDTWAKKILSINLTTRLATTLVNDVTYPVGVAVDWILGNIYWVDSFKHVVEATNSSGQIWTIILPSIYYPKDIAVAPIEGFFYVAVAGHDPHITRCRLDGSNCMKILENNIQKPHSIVVDHDPNNRRIYWTDTVADKIYSANLDGSNMVDVVTKLDHPIDLAIFGEQIFWSQRRSNHLHSVAKSGNVSSVTKYSVGEGRKISVVSEWSISLADIGWKLSPQGHAASNPCETENGGCQHLCFINANRDKVCKCGIGYELMSDGVSCDKKNKCSIDEFECVSTGLCINMSWKCDGSQDCDDGSDEDCGSRCDAEKFRCNNGGCIEASKKCDTYMDCGDKSDESEETCGPKTCSAGKWQCASLECIPKEWRCDGVKDCNDKSDEDGCPHVCPNGKFNCGNGRCIHVSWKCDGVGDCADGSDEVGCEPATCRPDDFACANGKCISKSLHCDGTDQCGDNSDEDERSNCTRSDCPPLHFKCTSISNDTVLACLPNMVMCDGKQDCFNAEDEKNCSNSCSLDEFGCPNSSRCIPSRWVCDGVQQCDGGEDEKQNCITTSMATTVAVTVRTKLCKESEFECADGECVLNTQTCNGVPDCQDGSDEGGVCLTSCKNNGGCPHICHPGPVSARCECNPGYTTIDKDCWDVNECQMESTCSHYCINTRGSFKCDCASGYMLEPDERTCKPENGIDMLFIVDKEEILIQSNKGATLTREKMPETDFKQSSISSVDIDPIRGLIMMADDVNGQILVHRIGMLKGTTLLPDSEKLIPFKDLQRPNALSLDYVHGNIYFSELITGTNGRQRRSYSHTTIMKVCSLSTSHCHIFYRGPNVTIPVSRVSVQTRKLFMCVNSLDDSAEILTSQLDGKNIWTLVNSGIVQCGDLALDEIKKRVYWSDIKLNVIEMVSFEGNGRQRIKNTMVYNPVGLGILENKLYWYNRDKREFVSCYSYDSDNNCSIMGLKWEPMAIGTKSAHAYHADANECKKLKCEQLCIPLPEDSAKAAQCLCQTGFVWLEEEAICVLAGTCENHPCGQGGDCVKMGHDAYMCKCHDGFSGISCEVEKEPVKYGWGIVALVVVLVLILVFLTCVAVLWFTRGGLQMWKKSNLESNLQFRFANPSFGVMDGRSTNATQSPLPRENPFNNPSPNSVPRKNTPSPNVESGFENKCFKELSETDNSEVLDIPPPTSVANENLSPYQPGPNYFR
ncbi:vitellogenin receptor Yl-like [Oratosquilla oratoria]|uniref:vitellogenin receptor Yl-like n=1 Tax=Oratosquilla oratoria TaxID=337810 RepID=UPI003F77147B